MLFARWRRAIAEIELERLTKVYSDGTKAVKELDLTIGDGEFTVLVGPSGCGKTTALRMVAGLEPVTEGEVRIGGRVVNNLPPKNRDIAMVFQNYALYPHMSAYRNMAFGLKLRKFDKAEIDRRVKSAAEVLGLRDVLGKRPRTLSGGQRQRVAMGRAIVREPQAFLMDEPLLNLDAKLRVEMRAEIARIQRDLAVTTIYVTHDQTEALTLGERVAVMRDGVLQQYDVPQRLYDHPVNLFVAEFIGSPAMNLVGADLVREDGRLEARFGGHRLAVDEGLLEARPALRVFEGKPLSSESAGGLRTRRRWIPTVKKIFRRPWTSERTWAPRSSSTSPWTAGPCTGRTSRPLLERIRWTSARSTARSSWRDSAGVRASGKATTPGCESPTTACTSSTRRRAWASTAASRKRRSPAASR